MQFTNNITILLITHKDLDPFSKKSLDNLKVKYPKIIIKGAADLGKDLPPGQQKEIMDEWVHSIQADLYIIETNFPIPSSKSTLIDSNTIVNGKAYCIFDQQGNTFNYLPEKYPSILGKFDGFSFAGGLDSSVFQQKFEEFTYGKSPVLNQPQPGSQLVDLDASDMNEGVSDVAQPANSQGTLVDILNNELGTSLNSNNGTGTINDQFANTLSNITGSVKSLPEEHSEIPGEDSGI